MQCVHDAIVTCSALTLITFFLALPVASATDPCDLAVPVDVNGVHRHDLQASPDAFQFDIDEAGILVIEMSTPTGTGRLPRLSATHCDHGDDLVWSQQVFHAGRKIAIVVDRPASFALQLGGLRAFDPAGTLRLTSGFVPIDVIAAPGDTGSISACLQAEPPPPDDHPVDPDPDRACAVIVGGPGERDAPWGDRLVESIGCWSLHEDDHGDLADCATTLALATPIRARIDNPWGDDEDWFRISFHAVTTLRFDVTAEAATATALYDRQGHRLMTTTDPRGRSFANLEPGDYFLRITGVNATDFAYALQVDVIE